MALATGGNVAPGGVMNTPVRPPRSSPLPCPPRPTGPLLFLRVSVGLTALAMDGNVAPGGGMNTPLRPPRSSPLTRPPRPPGPRPPFLPRLPVIFVFFCVLLDHLLLRVLCVILVLILLVLVLRFLLVFL